MSEALDALGSNLPSPATFVTTQPRIISGRSMPDVCLIQDQWLKTPFHKSQVTVSKMYTRFMVHSLCDQVHTRHPLIGNNPDPARLQEWKQNFETRFREILATLKERMEATPYWHTRDHKFSPKDKDDWVAFLVDLTDSGVAEGHRLLEAAYAEKIKEATGNKKKKTNKKKCAAAKEAVKEVKELPDHKGVAQDEVD